MSRQFYLMYDQGNTYFPIGLLTVVDKLYRFQYLRGNKMALLEFPVKEKIYESTSLFATFQNKIMSPKRPDYEKYLNWRGLDKSNVPLDIFRIYTTSVTNSTTVIEKPQMTNTYDFRFSNIRFFLKTSMNEDYISAGDKLDLIDNDIYKDDKIVGELPVGLTDFSTDYVKVRRINDSVPLAYRYLCEFEPVDAVPNMNYLPL